MKAVMLLVLAGACAMTPTTGPLPIRVLQSGSYAAGPGSAPAIEVATDEERYRVLWQSVMAGKVPPPVDFTKESVVLLFLGERPTGGYALEPLRASVEGASVRIVVETKTPPAGSMVTQALTYPFAVVAIAKPRLERVEWIDRDGRTVVRGDVRKR